MLVCMFAQSVTLRPVYILLFIYPYFYASPQIPRLQPGRASASDHRQHDRHLRQPRPSVLRRLDPKDAHLGLQVQRLRGECGVDGDAGFRQEQVQESATGRTRKTALN